MTHRTPLFDLAKAIIMLRVIAGHLWGNNVIECPVWGMTYFLNYTVGMAMPMFFLLSGYFSKRSIANGRMSNLIAREIGLLWPVFSFGILFAALTLLFSDGREIQEIMCIPFKRFLFAGWFLRTLGIIYLSSFLISKFAKSKWKQILCHGILYFVILALPSNEFFFWTQYLLHMYPYFMIGLFWFDWEFFKRNVVLSMLLVIVCLTIVVTEGDCKTNGMGFYWVTLTLKTLFFDVHSLLLFAIRIFVALTGSLLLFFLLDKLLLVAPWIGKWSVLGTTTLGVYVMHEWFIQYAAGLMIVPLPSWMLWIVAIAVLLVCHYTVLGITRVSVLQWFFLPSEKKISEWINIHMMCGKKIDLI